MKIASYIIINFILFLSWYLFLFRYRRILLFPDRLIGTFYAGLAQIIITEIILGAVFRQLYSLPLFFLNLFISISIMIFSLLTIYRDKESNIITDFLKESHRYFILPARGISLKIIFIMFLVMVFWIIFLGYLFPPYTWDGLWYHLPIVGYILQDGAIREVPNISFINQFINIFPKNIELFFLWNIIFLKDNTIVDLSQLCFLIVGIISIYSLCLKIKLRHDIALFSSLLFFFTPIAIIQSKTVYVDVAISVLFLSSMNFLVGAYECERQKRDIYLLLSGVTSGILLGAKGSGPLYLILISLYIFIGEIRKLRSYPHTRAIPIHESINNLLKRYVFIFLFPVILIGGCWYFKNWIIYGNPVYPMEISFLGKTLFKGLYRGIIEPEPEIIKKLNYITRPLYVWLENIRYYLYDSRLGGLGPIWFILLFPSIVIYFIVSVLRCNNAYIRIALVMILAFLVYPRNWTPRYVIFIVGFGAVSLACLMNYLENKERPIRFLSVILVIYTFMTINTPCIIPSQINKFLNLSHDKRTVARMAPFNIDLHARQDYGYWIWISENIKAGDVLAYTFDPLFLAPLWNSEFSNKIVYIKADTFNDWIRDLKRENVTYILLRRNSPEDRWIEKKFKLVYQDNNYRIYSVL